MKYYSYGILFFATLKGKIELKLYKRVDKIASSPDDKYSIDKKRGKQK